MSLTLNSFKKNVSKKGKPYYELNLYKTNEEGTEESYIKALCFDTDYQFENNEELTGELKLSKDGSVYYYYPTPQSPQTPQEPQSDKKNTSERVIPETKSAPPDPMRRNIKLRLLNSVFQTIIMNDESVTNDSLNKFSLWVASLNENSERTKIFEGIVDAILECLKKGG